MLLIVSGRTRLRPRASRRRRVGGGVAQALDHLPGLLRVTTHERDDAGEGLTGLFEKSAMIAAAERERVIDPSGGGTGRVIAATGQLTGAHNLDAVKAALNTTR